MTVTRARLFACLSAAAALAACATPPPAPTAAPVPMDAASIHARALTIDTHVDIPLNYATAAMDPGGFTTDQVDLPKMRAGGLDATFLILYTPQGDLDAEGYARAREIDEIKWAAIRRMTAAYPDQVALVTTPEEARRAVGEGKLAAFIGMENPFPLGESVEDVPMWAARGVRYMGLVHFGHNQFADSANPNPARGEPDSLYDGLSPLGEQLVAALNRAGVMVDVSHASKASMMDAVALSRAPILASHSGAAGVFANPRNLDDEQLRAIAQNGGVAQMVAFASYVKAVPPGRADALAALRARYEVASDAEAMAFQDETRAAAYALERAEIDADFPIASVSDFVDHVDHAVMVAGIDHVGIASDFDGGGGVLGWSDASETQAVTEELLRRGYTEEQIDKIWGGNVLRVLGEVERIGRELRGEE